MKPNHVLNALITKPIASIKNPMRMLTWLITCVARKLKIGIMKVPTKSPRALNPAFRLSREDLFSSSFVLIELTALTTALLTALKALVTAVLNFSDSRHNAVTIATAPTRATTKIPTGPVAIAIAPAAPPTAVLKVENTAATFPTAVINDPVIINSGPSAVKKMPTVAITV